MSENNAIYEIAQKISNTSVVKNDMNEASELVMQMFKDKYFNRLNSAISDHHMRCQKNPSKEVQLLHAMKPFLPGNQGEMMDRFIQFMLLRDTADSVKSELNVGARPAAFSGRKAPVVKAVESPAVSESIHEDGVYDVDRSCLISKRQNSTEFPGLLFMMALMMR